MTKRRPIDERAAAMRTETAVWPAWLPQRLLTIDEVAEKLQVSTKTVRRMLKDGLLQESKVRSRIIRVRPESVLALIYNR